MIPNDMLNFPRQFPRFSTILKQNRKEFESIEILSLNADVFQMKTCFSNHILLYDRISSLFTSY